MSFFTDLLKAKHTHSNFPGVLPDTRTPEEKAKDYIHEEFTSAHSSAVMGAMYEWREKPMQEWKKFPIKNQDGSSSCVAQAIAKVLGMENAQEEDLYVDLSAAWAYAHRSNFPGEGMIIQQAMDFVCKNGVTLEYFMPSDGKSEAELNTYVGKKLPASIGEVAKVYKPAGYVEVMSRDINELAAIAEQHPLVMGCSFDYNEWTEEPRIITKTPLLRHLVAGMEGTLYKGNKRLIIDDSWKEDATILKGKRLISQEFLTNRCFYIGYFLDLSNTHMSDQKKIPQVNFQRDLSYGDTGADVAQLQDILKYEGFFPTDKDSTGNYFGLTAAGVSKLRVKYDLQPGPEFGPLTRAIINKKYK